MIMAFIFCH